MPYYPPAHHQPLHKANKEPPVARYQTTHLHEKQSMAAPRRELGDKIPFNGVLFGLFHLGALVGCIPGHGPLVKATIVGLLSWASYHLITKTSTGDFAGDMGIGSVILMQFLVVFDCMFFTDPNSLKNYHEPHPGKITDQPLSKRVRWAFNLYTSNRGVGWAHEPRVLPKRPPPATPRWKFVFGRLTTTALGFMLSFAAVIANASNPGLTTPGKPLSEAAFPWRVLGAVGFVIPGQAHINGLHCILSAVVVGLGFSQPERWPNMFGSFLDAWSVQNVWRLVWHQMLRKSLTGFTDFIQTKVLGLRPLSHKTNNKILDTTRWMLWLYTIFFAVGVVHLGGEYMLLGRPGFGALKFFSLQAVGITLERIISFIWFSLSSKSKSTNAPNGRATNGIRASKSAARQSQNNNNNHPRIWLRLIGYLWVVCWFTWTLGYLLEPMVSTGMFVLDSRHDLRKHHWTSVVSQFCITFISIGFPCILSCCTPRRL